MSVQVVSTNGILRVIKVSAREERKTIMIIKIKIKIIIIIEPTIDSLKEQ